MRTFNKYLLVILSGLVIYGCEDTLNKVPQGGTLTVDEKKIAVEYNPALLSADVAAMYSNMIEYMGVLGSLGSFHNDFGYAAACLYMDSNGADMTAPNIGYNWFSTNASYADREYSGTRTRFMWSLFYKQIASANIVIASVDPQTTDATLKSFLGQALAVRAFAYTQLAQTHQFTYLGHEDEPCVPIITEQTTVDQIRNNPRATVQAVYDLIMDDLNTAITMLDGFVRQDKGYINQAVAYGLRARVNLIMGEYAAAAEDADEALTLSGATPYTLADVSKPNFYSANDATVLWANIITENNDIVQSGIVNMPSHLCSFFTDGYVGVGAWKKINKPLFDRIPATDVRKGWWLDENENSPLVADPSYAAWRATASADGDFGAYVNVKFAADNEDLAVLVPAQDWFLMRAEEMIFIKAEGLAMSSRTAEAKTLIEDFIKTNRDASYSMVASSATQIQDEIWFQRRIELWGEGHSYFDVMRLKKPIERVVNGVSTFPDAWQFNIPAEAPILLWLVPKAEIEANDGISEDDNNEKVDPPKAS